MSAIRTTLKAIMPKLDKALENLGKRLDLGWHLQLVRHHKQLSQLKALSAFDAPLLDSDLYLSADDADLIDSYG